MLVSMPLQKQKFKTNETYVLSILLYGVLLVYLYQFTLVLGKYKTFTTDEKFYYIEAKAISADNIYQAPASLDGNTSFIGNFGFHGISYALKDGWLAKLFFQPQKPPLVWNNIFTCLLTMVIILLFKPFSLNIRIKIALMVSTHYVLFSYTLSYMQETIHYFFAVIALWNLYLLYTNEDAGNKKYLFSYILLIVIAITFRYGWFLWGLGLLPLARNYKTFFLWGLVVTSLLLFGIFVNHNLVAPYPYDGIIADKLIQAENFSLFNSIKIIFEKFFSNLQLYITPSGIAKTTIMRYLLLALLFVNTWYAVTQQNRFIIACALVGWGYFFSALAFYHVYWSYDERALAVLNPLLAFSLIGVSNKLLFYPIVLIQLLLFPRIVKETEERNETAIEMNRPTPEHLALQNSYSNIGTLITDEKSTVVNVNISMVRHGTPDYFIDLPLVNSKGYPIHYLIYRNGTNIRGIRQPDYLLDPSPAALPENSQLVYSDARMSLYKVIN
jgi:hypothetical protein